MKFRCERDVLAEAVGSAARAATNQTGTLPVLAGIRMEIAGDSLTITGTDLELTIRLTIDVGGDRDGAAVVPARLVGDIVKALPAGSGASDRNDDEMSISAGRSEFSVRPLSLDDYPVQSESSAESVIVPAEAMAEALSQVVRAASTDDARAGGGSIQLLDYLLMPALSCDNGQIEIGVFCHEYGHAFGLPDLYDTNGQGEGIGHWGLMGSGNWNAPSNPAHMSAWAKEPWMS